MALHLWKKGFFMIKEYNLEDGGYLRIEIIDDEEIQVELPAVMEAPKNPIQTELDNLAEDMKKLEILMGNLTKQ
jgi:hypothetical protein